MVTRLRSVKIVVEVDTNKWTKREEFKDIDEAKEWLEDQLDDTW